MDPVFSFLLWTKCEARGPWKQGRKKQGSITCCTDRANKANKMFIIWLFWLFQFWKDDWELELRTATYRPGIDQSQLAKSVSHIIKNIKTRKEVMEERMTGNSKRQGESIDFPVNFVQCAVIWKHLVFLWQFVWVWYESRLILGQFSPFKSVT